MTRPADLLPLVTVKWYLHFGGFLGIRANIWTSWATVGSKIWIVLVTQLIGVSNIMAHVEKCSLVSIETEPKCKVFEVPQCPD